MLGLYKGELLKLSKTPFFVLHLLLPILGIGAFSLYTKLTSYSLYSLVGGYFQILGLVYLVVVPWICTVVYQPEIEAGHGYNMLSAVSRNQVLFVKTSYLLGFGLPSCLLATLGFGVVSAGIKEEDIGLQVFFVAGLILWGVAVFLYLLHSWLHLRFGRNVSFGVGATGMLLSALMFTGLGDGIWYYIPSAWGIRFVSMFYHGMQNNIPPVQAAFVKQELVKGSIMVLVVTVVSACLIGVWFSRWEGCNDEE